jgi:adenylylsulfate reductase subunit B
MPPKFNREDCVKCNKCVDLCPGDVLEMDEQDGPVVRYADECWHCGNCRIDCPSGAVQIQFPLSMLI